MTFDQLALRAPTGANTVSTLIHLTLLFFGVTWFTRWLSISLMKGLVLGSRDISDLGRVICVYETGLKHISINSQRSVLSLSTLNIRI